MDKRAGVATEFEQDVARLCQALSSIKSASAMRALLSDLCTPSEITALADRWKVARLLNVGLPYREIYERTGVSTATVTRVARALDQGAGGYRAALEAPRRAGRR